MRGKMNHLLENRNLLHLALHEAVSESKGRSRESIGDGRLGTLVVIVRQAVLEGAQVVFLHIRVAEHNGEPLIVRDVLHLSAQYLPRFLMHKSTYSSQQKGASEARELKP